MTVVEQLIEALRIGTGFLWTAGWAIIMGLVITSCVQVYVSKDRIAGLLGEDDLGALFKATGFGASSSGCSFGAAAIAKGLFKKGAHPVNTLAFMFASTNSAHPVIAAGSSVIRDAIWRQESSLATPAEHQH